MPLFKKKPVLVDAEQWNGPGCVTRGVQRIWGPENGGTYRYYVITAHGQQAYLAPGDWVICEPDGRGYYPCKPDIFEATYEKVE
jgi:hypothetical protein